MRNAIALQGTLTRYADDLLSSIRLELFLGLVETPIVESRKHIPGDIFLSQLHNGSLRLLDEDRLLMFELTALPYDLIPTARLESIFLYQCAKREALFDYIKGRLSVLDRRPIAPFVQYQFMDMIRGHASSDNKRTRGL